MFTLELDKNRYYKVKKGQTAEEIAGTLGVPVNFKVFAGAIIFTDFGETFIYTAEAGDTFKKVAEKFKVPEELLKELNGGRCIYPSKKLFVPKKVL